MLRRLLALALTAAALAGFWYFENYRIETEEYTLCSSRLPAAFDGLRVVEIADLHGKMFGSEGEDLLEAVRAAKPDLIALDGDLADEKSDAAAVARLAGGLAEIAPTYYVTGNHEWVMDDLPGFLALLEAEGVTVLRNEYRVLRQGGQTMVVAGVDDPNGPYDQKTPEQLVSEIREDCGDAFILMLAHRNDQLELWSSLEVDAVLAGHGHGGVVRLPFLGPVFGSGGSLFPKDAQGLYRRGRTALLVSRGLGSTGLPLRLFNRPHLPVLVLRAGV